MLWRLIGMLKGDMSAMDMSGLMVEFAATAAVVLLCLPVHECAHAWTAKKLGDDTAWMHGRLTLNPSKHLDLFGTLMILVVGFGYAKPVPVNPRNFKNGKYKRGMALTAAAGPLSNLILAVIFCLAAYLAAMAGRGGNDLADLLEDFFFKVFGINVSLVIFNLIPFPPLDGSRILDLILPHKVSMFLSQYENILRWAVFALLIFSSPIGELSRLASNGISRLVGLPFPFYLIFTKQ